MGTKPFVPLKPIILTEESIDYYIERNNRKKGIMQQRIDLFQGRIDLIDSHTVKLQEQKDAIIAKKG